VTEAPIFATCGTCRRAATWEPTSPRFRASCRHAAFALGTSDAGCCSKCGKPWERVTEITYLETGRRSNGPRSVANRDSSPGFAKRKRKVVRSLGFAPKCACNASSAPCVVLDPFLGSGTVAEAAIGHGRRFVGFELSRDYHALIESRLGLFKDAA
jgi:hypothetical protein